MERINKQEVKNTSLQLIPKAEKYIQYMIDVINKMPRTEKFNIGNEYKNTMYEMLKSILYVNKIEEKNRMYYLNKIDADLNFQRILLRIMEKNRWMDSKKFDVAILQIGEIGKMLGGMIKYYAKKNS